MKKLFIIPEITVLKYENANVLLASSLPVNDAKNDELPYNA